MNPSDEQKQILDEIRNNNSVIGDCVAGSGKTTTVLFLAKTFPDKKILQITYNSQLKIEVREKVEQSNLTNLEIHTYHSLAVRYYDERAHDDNIINYIIKNDVQPKSYIPKFDIIVIDETQDMTLLFYKLIHKFLDDHNSVIQMLVLGDKYQSIYQFKGADVRYLTLSSKLWNKSVNFVNKTLNTSYRLTNQMSSFINNVMLGEERIKTEKNGFPVTYLYGNIFNLAKDTVFKYIYDCINTNTLQPDDIFILAPSIKKKDINKDSMNPIKLLENRLVSKNIPIYYPTSDDSLLDDNIIKGKIVFSTYHQSKGRERKLVIIFGFDSSYFQYYDKNSNPNVCSSALYVAATRAKSQLIVLHGENNEALPFFKKTLEELKSLNYIHFIDHSNVNKKKTEIKSVPTKHVTSPTELVKFLSEKLINELSLMITELFTLKEQPSFYAKIPNKLQFDNNLFEDVSDINGLVIPSIYEEKHTGICTIRIASKHMYNKIKDTNQHKYLKSAFDKLETIENPIEQYVYLGIMYISLKEDIYNKVNQISSYNWLTEDMVNTCLAPLKKHLIKKTDYEQSICFECDLYYEYEPITITGRLDAIDDETIWELKCVDNLTFEHFLQLIIYSWMWKHAYFNSFGKRSFKLLNMKTGELFELIENSSDIEKIMKLLFDFKFSEKIELNDDEFIEKCLSTRNDIDFIYSGNNSCMIVED